MTASSCPVSEHSSGTMRYSLASGVTSAFSTPASPQTLRAYSISAYWKPPQVPRNGIRCSRAGRMAEGGDRPLGALIGAAGHQPDRVETAQIAFRHVRRGDPVGIERDGIAGEE